MTFLLSLHLTRDERNFTISLQMMQHYLDKFSTIRLDERGHCRPVHCRPVGRRWIYRSDKDKEHIAGATRSRDYPWEGWYRVRASADRHQSLMLASNAGACISICQHTVPTSIKYPFNISVRSTYRYIQHLVCIRALGTLLIVPRGDAWYPRSGFSRRDGKIFRRMM